jgi:anti-sigma regulatory factor (Ser/Thr protein kinase)
MNLWNQPGGPERTMDIYSAKTDGERLTLEGRLSEIARVPPWIERVVAPYAVPSTTTFAMELCLEEVLSNIIRHGHGGESSHEIVIRYRTPCDGFFTFVVEDDAPPFNPLLTRDPPSPPSLGDISVGGQGIHLLKRFADAVEYEPTPTGNRLIVRFSSPRSRTVP